MSWRAGLFGTMVTIVGLWSFDAGAQSVERAPRFEIGGGVSWTWSTSFGSRDALLTTSTGGSYRLFSTSTDLASVIGAEVMAGVRVSRGVVAEVVTSYSTPDLRTTIANDAEGASPVTAVESIRQFTIGGAAVVDLTRLRARSGLIPFVRAGAGYLRQLHESQTLIETGQVYDVGGGIRFPLRSSAGSQSTITRVGVRVEGRATIRSGGIALDGGTHASPTLAASAFVRF